MIVVYKDWEFVLCMCLCRLGKGFGLVDVFG